MCALTVHGPWSMSKSSEESSFDAHNIEIVGVTEKRRNVSSPAATIGKGSRTDRFHAHKIYNIYGAAQVFR